MKRRVTITDIARAVGVTDGTVSRALRRDKRVRPDTRDRILAAASAAGYIPNLSARHFKHGRTHNIGVFCDSGAWMLYNDFFGRLIAGLTEAAVLDGYRVVIYTSEDNPPLAGSNPYRLEVQLRGVQELQDGRVDGAVFLGGRKAVLDDLGPLRKIRLPTVLLSNNVPEEGFFQMMSGARERARQATRLLVKRQGKAPAFLGLYHDSTYNAASEEGWKQALAESGLKAPKEWMLSLRQADIADAAEIKTLATRVFDAGAVGLVCSEGVQALRIIDMAEAGQLRLPQGFLLASFGDLSAVRLKTPDFLILANADLKAYGGRAFGMLKEALDGKTAHTETISWLFPSELPH